MAGVALIVGVGSIVISKVCDNPGHPLATGVTVIVAVTAFEPALVPLNAAMFPVPLAPRPIEVLSFVQLKVVPLTEPEKTIAVVALLLQTTWLAGSVTVGVGLALIVNDCDGPVQPLAKGVTAKVAVTEVVPELIAVNAAIAPVPLEANPIAGRLLVQVYVVPVTVPLKLITEVEAPLQTTWLAGSTTVGVGFTVMVKVSVGPVHPLAEGVTLMVATTGVDPVFTAANETMLPLPLAARPMEGWLLVQLNVVPATAPLKIIAAVEAPLHIV